MAPSASAHRLLPLLLLQVTAWAATPCDPRSFGQSSVVCVCSASYCDTVDAVPSPGPGQYTVVTSTIRGDRFQVASGDLSNSALPAGAVIHLGHANEYQSMLGFGGAFTDSFGINVKSLSGPAQENLLKSYFSSEGLEYNLCRTPIGGCDFSTRPYSYDDVPGDTALQFFALQEEDLLYKLPLIIRAQELTPSQIFLIGSPWSPPAWMKENGQFNGSGGILKENWQPYSNYFVKFVQAYESAGVPLWGLTTQNEPLVGFEDWMWNACAWTPEDMRDWIKSSLGPTLETAGMRRLKLMVLDHNRDSLPLYPSTMLTDVDANKYIDGVAVHWYDDLVTSPQVMDDTQALFPDKFLLYTEACEGWNSAANERVLLGSWVRAENYASNIIEDVNHFSTGWVDWNMALDMNGGPNWANNFVDAPIIINKDADEFYKQPMYYAMGHFSKWVPRDSKRILSHTVEPDIKVAAFHTPNGNTVLVLLNTGNSSHDLSVMVSANSYVTYTMQDRSIQTLIVNTPAA